MIEGSAVPKGSNNVTPVIETIQHQDKSLVEDEAAEEALRQKQADEKRKQVLINFTR